MSNTLFDTHRETLQNAVRAIHDRTCFSAYPEIPSGKIYGETAKKDGYVAFQGRLNTPFAIEQPGTDGQIGAEVSPFGLTLGVTYPKCDLDTLMPAVVSATHDWKNASPEVRTGVCLEILQRLNRRSFELANAVMHTTGQGFMMAFQAGGPHAQDRGLEAVAYAWESMRACPGHVTWEKRVSKTDTVTLSKTYRIVPRGVAVTVGCSTFPTWNGYPGIFASLATGNAVVIKPHPGAVLPLAITVEIMREVLAEQGFDPNLVTLAVDTADTPITKDLVTRPEVGIVDYTGSSDFGTWIERNATQAIVFTEKAGVNPAVIDSLDDLKAVTGNIAFTLSLYSGQMCTTTQNIFIPRSGITVGGEPMSFDDAAGAIVKAVNWLLGDDARAAEILGAIQNPHTLERVRQTREAVVARGGTVLREATPVNNEAFPDARTCSPLIVQVDAADRDLFEQEAFGPVVFIVTTDSTEQGIELAAGIARAHGAITAAAYSTNPGVLEAAEDALVAAGAAVSFNLVGHIYVNQSAAFSDFHVSGANPAGNATLCDGAFIAGRFRVVQSRTLVPAAAPVGA